MSGPGQYCAVTPPDPVLCGVTFLGQLGEPVMRRATARVIPLCVGDVWRHHGCEALLCLPRHPALCATCVFVMFPAGAVSLGRALLESLFGATHPHRLSMPRRAWQGVPGCSPAVALGTFPFGRARRKYTFFKPNSSSATHVRSILVIVSCQVSLTLFH